MSSRPALGYRYFENPGGPLILYLHGFLGCKEDWNEVAGILGDRYAHLMVDLPGHGQSSRLKDSSYTMTGCAKHLVELLTYFHINTCHVVAYSMGGRLALHLAVNHAERFGRFVIESASPGLETEAERLERTRRDCHLAQTLETEGITAFVESWYNQPLFASLDKTSSRFQELVRRRLVGDPDRLARSLRLMGTGVQLPLWGQLNRLSTPILFLAGSKDTKFRQLASRMAHLCRNGQVAIISGAGHNVHFEQPVAYCNKIAEFLDDE